VAALVLGGGLTWNIANVGAVAEPLADAYGVSLAVVGLFTTALFLTHLAAQLPAGRSSDRLGPRTVGFAAIAAAVLGNLLLLVDPHPALAIVGRAIVGLGSGAGFVAGAEYMRSVSASPVLQGAFGASTMAGGGLAVAVVPQLVGPLGWRAPYWSALAAAAVTAAVLLASRLDVRLPAAPRRVVFDRHLTRLGLLHAATFGLSVVAANWVVPLLERQGYDRSVAAPAGALLLLAGILTRPLGGVLADRRRPLVASIVAGAAGLAALALPAPFGVLVVAAAVAGLAAGLPFATIISGAQRLRADAPGAAVGFVNMWAIAAIVVGTPLLGISFALPGDGRLGFAALAALWALAVATLFRSR